MPGHKQRIATMHKTLITELGQDPNQIEQRSRAELAAGYNGPIPGPIRRQAKTAETPLSFVVRGMCRGS